MGAIGRHVLIEFYDCQGPLGKVAQLERVVARAVESCGAVLLHYAAHQFQPVGVTAIALLAESHLALHTWPEENYVAVDLFTCSERVKPESAFEVLASYFLPGRTELREVERGPLVRPISSTLCGREHDVPD